jgi:hypothetical protein
VALQAGMREAATQRARRYSDPHSWEYTIGQYAVLCGALAQGKARVREAVV